MKLTPADSMSAYDFGTMSLAADGLGTLVIVPLVSAPPTNGIYPAALVSVYALAATKLVASCASTYDLTVTSAASAYDLAAAKLVATIESA